MTLTSSGALAGLEVVLDVLLVDLGLDLVGDEHHDDVGLLRRVIHAHDLEAGLLCRLGGLGALAQAHADVHAGVHEVERMGVALGAVADDGDLLAQDHLGVDVVLVVDGDGHAFLLSLAVRCYAHPPRRTAGGAGWGK